MGTIINALAVVAGGVFGMAIKGGLPKRVSDLLMQALGLCTMFIGMTGAISGMMKIEDGVLVSQGTMLLIASLGIGAVVGELLDIEGKMEQLAERIKKMVHSDDNRFIEGFVANALVICVGAMAVVGALQDGLTHDPSMLITKAILDGIISMVFALLAGVIAPLFDAALITNLSFVGSVLIFGVGINLFFGKQIRIGNLLPALLIPIAYAIICSFL